MARPLSFCAWRGVVQSSAYFLRRRGPPTMEQNEKINPPQSFSERAAIKSMQQYEELYAAAAKDPDKFWADEADHLHWFKKWTQVSDWSNAPFAKWFVGAKTNVSYNCIDRHLT